MPATRSGPSSSATAPPRSLRAFRAARRSSSCPARCPSRDRPRRRSRALPRLPWSSSGRPPNGPRRSRTRRFARRSRGPPRPRSQRLRTAAPSDTVFLARKCGICRAFFMAESDYTAKDITVLEGLEPVRLRPGMYIGSTGLRGLHHLVYEIVDNSVDEALAGYNDAIEVTLHPDHSVTVVDHGRGMPVDTMAGTDESALTTILTKLHAGGKFGGSGYKVSGGLHGVGASVVNALSERLVAEVRRDGMVHRQEFERGEPVGDMEVVGEMAKGEPTGTTITFLPDSEVFEELDVEAATVTQRLRETAFLTRGLYIKLVDERADGKTAEFHYENGIRDFVAYINETKDPIHKRLVYFEGDTE